MKKYTKIKPCGRQQTVRSRWAQGMIQARLQTRMLLSKFLIIFSLFCIISVSVFIILLVYSLYMMFNVSILLISLLFIIPMCFNMFNMFKTISKYKKYCYLYFDKSDIVLLLLMPLTTLLSGIFILDIGFIFGCK